VCWRAADRRQLVQHPHHVFGPAVPAHLDRQAFAGALVQHHQHPQRAAVGRVIVHEVHAPHLVLAHRAATHDAVLAGANPPALAALLRH
jgi:hypothetical protein